MADIQTNQIYSLTSKQQDACVAWKPDGPLFISIQQLYYATKKQGGEPVAAASAARRIINVYQSSLGDTFSMCTWGRALITTRNEQIWGFIDSYLLVSLWHAILLWSKWPSTTRHRAGAHLLILSIGVLSVSKNVGITKNTDVLALPSPIPVSITRHGSWFQWRSPPFVVVVTRVTGASSKTGTSEVGGQLSFVSLLSWTKWQTRQCHPPDGLGAEGAGGALFSSCFL